MPTAQGLWVILVLRGRERPTPESDHTGKRALRPRKLPRVPHPGKRCIAICNESPQIIKEIYKNINIGRKQTYKPIAIRYQFLLIKLAKIKMISVLPRGLLKRMLLLQDLSRKQFS